MRATSVQTFALSAGLLMLACSASSGSQGETEGGAPGTGGKVSAGAPGNGGTNNAAGGATNGGSGTGGSSSGGAPGNGGANAKGGNTGAGGSGTGGSSMGGASGAMGGRANGGSGGKASGGTSSGGTSNTGGAASGGKSSGGASGSGGSGTAGSTSINCNGTPKTGGKTYTSNIVGNVGNGYSFQLWSNGVGSGSMTVYGSDATFKATWSSVGDFLARVGLGFDSTKTYDQLGTISADYAYTRTGTGGGFSYIGIYGWSVSPLVEWYIVDDWFGNKPNPGTKGGTVSADGATYDVYTHTQNNQPAITGGNATFPQFFSVRQTPRQCGHISISEHFKAWAAQGHMLGKMEEARILVEVGGGSGSIDYTTATVTAQ